jgi:hypothetical protein
MPARLTSTNCFSLTFYHLPQGQHYAWSKPGGKGEGKPAALLNI